MRLNAAEEAVVSEFLSNPWRVLPDKPNLEQLKNQAKDLLRDYVAGDAAAVAEVERAEKPAAAPRRGAEFGLADAQRVLARAYGYASWPALKQFVDGVTVARLCDAAKAGDVATIRQLLRARPELVGMDLAENDEHRAIHFAVLHRHAEAVAVLMAAGSDARKGIYPNRAQTTALVIAQDRGYGEIVDAIEKAEQARREAASCPNVTVTPVQDQIVAAIRAGKNDEAIAQLSADSRLIKACDRDGASPLHIAAEALNDRMVEWLLEPSRRANIQKTDLAGRMPLDRAVMAVEPRNKDSLQRFAPVAERLRMAGAPLTAQSAIALGEGDRLAELFRDEPGKFSPGAEFIKPLTIAVRHRRHDILRLLLDLGLDPNERTTLSNVEGQVTSLGAPLWMAVLGDDWDAATILLDRGADPNANVYASGTATSQAFGTRNARMQKLMLERGGTLSPDFLGLYRQTDAARRVLDGTDPVPANPRGYPGPTSAEEQLCSGAAPCGGDPEIVRLALEENRLAAERSALAVQHGRAAAAHLEQRPRPLGRRIRPLDLRRMFPPDHRPHGRQHRQPTRPNPAPTASRRMAGRGARAVMTDPKSVLALRDDPLLDAGAEFDMRDELLASTPRSGWAAVGAAARASGVVFVGGTFRRSKMTPSPGPRRWRGRLGTGMRISRQCCAARAKQSLNFAFAVG